MKIASIWKRSKTDNSWSFFVDTGGTFADCLAVDAASKVYREKVLSSSRLRLRLQAAASRRQLTIPWSAQRPPSALVGMSVSQTAEALPTTRTIVDAEYCSQRSTALITLDAEHPYRGDETIEIFADEEAPILAARLITGTPVGPNLPHCEFRLATTKGTNALLQRRGAETLFLVTKGFGDLLAIGTQQRSDLFSLDVTKSDPFYCAAIEIDERIDAQGRVIRPLSIDQDLEQELLKWSEQGVTTAAVALANSYTNSAHEHTLSDLLNKCGFTHISRSSEISKRIGFLQRSETAVVNAYLSPAISNFLARVAGNPPTNDKNSLVAQRSALVMTSAAGLQSAAHYCAKDSLLSGPAAGVLGAVAAAESFKLTSMISFDMGGTSTDVARYVDQVDFRSQIRVGDAQLNTTAVDIETVAAGGGSICSVCEGRFFVGPQSAGATPGPACYGAGGPLTLTDVCLLLGRLDSSRFQVPIDEAAAWAALKVQRDAYLAATGSSISNDDLLDGFFSLANEKMAQAITKVSVRRGHHLKNSALVAFGGAGPQHACAVADALEITSIVVPSDAGILSAAGLRSAPVERIAESQILKLFEDIDKQLPKLIETLETAATRKVQAIAPANTIVRIQRRIAMMRLLGQETSISVDFGSEPDLRGLFRQQYHCIYGHSPQRKPLELERIQIFARAISANTARVGHCSAGPNAHAQATAGNSNGKSHRARFRHRWCGVPFFSDNDLPDNTPIDGPALVAGDHCTTAVDPGWKVTKMGCGLLIQRNSLQEHSAAISQSSSIPAAFATELFASRLAGIAEEMGGMLQRTAVSTNVKDRLDFSCGILDQSGYLLANAPHVPVHLGALGLCVRRVCESIPIKPGDVVVTNHPAFGGSHLPDVTVITPAFADGVHIGYTASRAHHAEIGGICPGSMSAKATRLADEGVIINPQYIQRAGKPQWDTLRQLLQFSPYPSRSPMDNLADLHAQMAANYRGKSELERLAKRMSTTRFFEAVEAFKGLASDQLCRALDRLDCFHSEAVLRETGTRRQKGVRESRLASPLILNGMRQVGSLQRRSGLEPDFCREAVDTLDDGTVIRVSIRHHLGKLRIDFSGTSGVHQGNLNATPAITRAAVIYVLKLLCGKTLPLNEGLMSKVALEIPSGCLNPQFHGDKKNAPAVGGGNVETSQRIVDCLCTAFGLCAHSQGTMNNVLFGNDRFGYYETIGGGTGAGPTFNGSSAVHSHMTNTRITDVEVLERRYPVRVERFAIRSSSGGSGKHSGGDGIIRQYTFLERLFLSLLTQRRTKAPLGVLGGNNGKPGVQTLYRKNGHVEVLDPIIDAEVHPGDSLVIETPGGGAWGAEV